MEVEHLQQSREDLTIVVAIGGTHHFLHLRDLSPSATRNNVTAIISVEEAKDREATWMEEAIFSSLGSGRVL